MRAIAARNVSSTGRYCLNVLMTQADRHTASFATAPSVPMPLRARPGYRNVERKRAYVPDLRVVRQFLCGAPLATMSNFS